MSLKKSILCTAGAMAFATTIQAYDNTEISFNDVPKHVLATAKQYAPSINFERYAVDNENGKLVYEFEGRDAFGKHIEIDVLPDGTLEEIELETSWDEVPVSIQIKLSIDAKDFKPSFIERSIRADGTTVYEFEAVQSDGTLREIEIMNDGRALKFVSVG